MSAPWPGRERVRCEARDLQRGDVLYPTMRVVVNPPSRGARTPAGKVELSLARQKRHDAERGPVQGALFGRYTTVCVLRPIGQVGPGERIDSADPTWKVCWSNGDEVYVRAADRPRALIEAGNRHGPTAANVTHCEVYG